MYLTYEQYKTNTYADNDVIADESTFNKFVPLATMVIDAMTMHRLEAGGFEGADDYTQTHVMNAMAAQMTYQAANGYRVLSDGRDQSVQSLTLGRTSLNFGTNGAGKTQSAADTVTAEETTALLETTGLLYRGLD